MNSNCSCPRLGRSLKVSTRRTVREGERTPTPHGAWRNSVLASLEQKLLFVLVYQKRYPLPCVIARLFGLSQSRADRWIHELLPLLRDALTELQMMPERNPKRIALGERRRSASSSMIIDDSERSRQRPKN